MDCLASGVPTRKARDEVVNSMTTAILVYTIRPTPNDLYELSKRLTERHPVLTDHIGNGYVRVVCLRKGFGVP